MTDEKAEDLLQTTLARCAASIAACLANADKAIEPGSGYSRGNELDRATALMSVAARVSDALTRLRGGKQTLTVVREGALAPKRHSNGRSGG